MKKYQIIYADPPWSYNDKMKGHQGAETHYKTQEKGWLSRLPIKNIADSDCVLFLWVVSPLIDECLDVLKAWGFKYKTIAFCWNKQTKNKKWVSNLGRWTMGNIELCLLGVKGKPKRIVKNIKQLVIAERKKHSQKPSEVRNRIVELIGDLPRIELFAREKIEGWDAIGYDIDGKDIQISLNEL